MAKRTATPAPYQPSPLDEVATGLCLLATGSCDCLARKRQPCAAMEKGAAWITRHVLGNASALKAALARRGSETGGER